ncbi:flagellar protein FlaG [Marinomonas sp. 2405UD68-3]|uniref:flagellar protein FlaG n=1 Tax=Marinomonas sp. 2405UD68-3 TaxID=3391835 RepID=UPI0039C9ECBB
MKSIDGISDLGVLKTPIDSKKNVEELVQKEVKGIESGSEKIIMEEKKENQDEVIKELKQNLTRLNQYIPVTSTNLVFEFDERDSSPFIKVFDKESNELIREIPSKEFREIAKALGEFAEKLEGKGVLLDEKV